jgi:hypothetical protein
VRRHHDLARDIGGDRGAVVAPDHVQAQVDTGGLARGGQYLAVVGVEHVLAADRTGFAAHRV